MIWSLRLTLTLLIPACFESVELAAADTPAVVPGLFGDGYVRLHNQSVIHPAGKSSPLGDFPVAMAMHPKGRQVAVLHAGAGVHEVRVLDIMSGQLVSSVALKETFQGIAYAPDGQSLVCSGSSGGNVLVFSVGKSGALIPAPGLALTEEGQGSVTAGLNFSTDGKRLFASLLYANQIVSLEFPSGRILWRCQLGQRTPLSEMTQKDLQAPNDQQGSTPVLAAGSLPLGVLHDAKRGRVYATLWGESGLAVIDDKTGRLLHIYPCGLHPNALVLSRDGRLFVSNGGLNTVTVLEADTGKTLEILCSAMDPRDPPGSTPDGLALSRKGRLLYVANAYNNNVAVFDVSNRRGAVPAGFIPTGWFPSSLMLTKDEASLLVTNARGNEAKSNSLGDASSFKTIKTLYAGTLSRISLDKGERMEFSRIARECHRLSRAGDLPPDAAQAQFSQVAPRLKHVIYIIKENRTYDQVLGDLAAGNGDPKLCLFPERITPNHHALAREFALFDNFYANAEISSSGHEWSTAGYSSEFVERSWPVSYGHYSTLIPYPSEGGYLAAKPAGGYIWDRCAAAGVSYRSYGEFVAYSKNPKPPFRSKVPALDAAHLDPEYMPWNNRVHDITRADRFISELHRFEALGDMPQFQLLRLPQDHTAGGRAGAWTPQAMVADNDLALGRIVEVLTHSKFWPDTAIFVVEDDAQDGPDHVDAHRTLAYVISPYTKRGVVDSTPYTTCSMLRTIEVILGLQPMSQFDAQARPMANSFTGEPDLRPYTARAANIDLEQQNPARGAAAALSADLDFSREDSADDHLLNIAIWKAVYGDASEAPAPRHAAFISPIKSEDDDD